MNIAIRTCSMWFRRVADEYRLGRPVALLFDFDGTLTPIVHHPSLARLTDRTRRQLSAFAALPRVHVGIISGRSLGELRGLVGSDAFSLAGSGGLEIELDGVTYRDPAIEDVSQLYDILEGTLIKILHRHPHTWLERKPGAMSIHFRGLSPLAACGFQTEVATILSEYTSLRLRVVSKAIEVMPSLGWNKGDAASAILKHLTTMHHADPVAIYFGDAPNDTEAMLIADQSGGVSIGIGDDAPGAARLHLPDAGLLPDCLDVLMLQLKNRSFLNEWESEELNRPLIDQSAPPVSDKGDLLILDPDTTSRAKLAAELERHGWRVWQSESPDEAGNCLRNHGDAIRVALVDLELPGLQCAKAVEEFGRARPGLLRCYMASDIRQDTAAAFAEISNKPLFLKPIQPAEMALTLDRLLEHESKSTC